MFGKDVPLSVFHGRFCVGAGERQTVFAGANQPTWKGFPWSSPDLVDTKLRGPIKFLICNWAKEVQG